LFTPTRAPKKINSPPFSWFPHTTDFSRFCRFYRQRRNAILVLADTRFFAAAVFFLKKNKKTTPKAEKMDNKRYFGRLKAPEEAVADIKTQRSAASKQKDLQRLLQKHRYALQKEE
jgi:hypothetical protein